MILAVCVFVGQKNHTSNSQFIYPPLVLKLRFAFPCRTGSDGNAGQFPVLVGRPPLSVQSGGVPKLAPTAPINPGPWP